MPESLTFGSSMGVLDHIQSVPSGLPRAGLVQCTHGLEFARGRYEIVTELI